MKENKSRRNESRKFQVRPLAIVAAVLIVLGIVLIANVVIDNGSGAGGSEGETADGSTDSADGMSNGSSGTDSDDVSGNGTGSDDSTGNANSGSDSDESSSGTSGSIAFPYTSELDSLELIALYDYSGYYIEDGSEDAIDSVAALEVRNISEEVIEYAVISITADGETLTFEVSLLPAGESCLVMEADRRSCSETAAVTYEGSEIAYLSELDMCEEKVSVSTDGTGAITIENISGEDISELRLFYKNQLEEGEYVGGIAYTAKIEDLSAGESIKVYPSHFDPEYGVVMMVRIYD